MQPPSAQASDPTESCSSSFQPHLPVPHGQLTLSRVNNPLPFLFFPGTIFSPTKPFSQSTSLSSQPSQIVSARRAFCINEPMGPERESDLAKLTQQTESTEGIRNFIPASLPGAFSIALRWLLSVRELLAEVKARTSLVYLTKGLLSQHHPHPHSPPQGSPSLKDPWDAPTPKQ